jgi:hypothetical protein
MVVHKVTTGFSKVDERRSMEKKIIKLRLSLCLIKHHVVRVYVELKMQVHLLLTSAVGGGES